MYYLLVWMMCVAIATPILAQVEHPAFNIKVAKTLSDYPDLYPNASAITLNATTSGKNSQFIFGTILAADVMLARTFNSLQFQSLQDVRMELIYPSPQNTAVISRMDVFISIDSKPFSCYVTSFAAGNSSISVWVQSKATNKFEYDVRFYGHKAVEYSSSEIQVAAKIKDYLEVYPNANVTRMNATRINNSTVRFWVGDGVGVADHLVSSSAANYSFPIGQDVALTLEYPEINGNAANVTYVEVLLTQGYYITYGYLISGGLSKDYIKLWIHSQNLTVFNYDAKIYGYFV